MVAVKTGRILHRQGTERRAKKGPPEGSPVHSKPLQLQRAQNSKITSPPHMAGAR